MLLSYFSDEMYSTVQYSARPKRRMIGWVDDGWTRLECTTVTFFPFHRWWRYLTKANDRGICFSPISPMRWMAGPAQEERLTSWTHVTVDIPEVSVGCYA
jgi:hypothetical protein